jgi:hypothetical protein
MKKGIIFGAIIIILALIASYFLFLHTKVCDNEECFKKELRECDRAVFTREGRDGSWYYRIKGKDNNLCVVKVKLFQLKHGSSDLESLEGKEMNCYVDLGTVINPEENLERCHGVLKEEIQTIIINRLHKYVINNLGEISDKISPI